MKSDGHLVLSGGDLVVIPPPRAKRSGLPVRSLAQQPQVSLRDVPASPVAAIAQRQPHKVRPRSSDAAQLLNNQNHRPVPPAKPPKPPVPPNDGLPIKAGKRPSQVKGKKTCTRLNRSTPSLLESVAENGGSKEHIYESVESRPLKVAKRPTGPPPPVPMQTRSDLINSLRLSADVQCWPWPKQTSLPPSINAPKKAPFNERLSKGIQGLRSVSLGRGSEPPQPPSGGGFLKRFAGFRRSFNGRDRAAATLRQERLAPMDKTCRRPDDPDWVFFRGFGGKKREDMEPYAVCHGPLLAVTSCSETPQAPPRRKRPARVGFSSHQNQNVMQPVLRRSLSFTDAHFIAQAVYEGDAKLIEELYPDFPRSEPIYAVVDVTKKRKSLNASTAQNEPPPQRERQLPVQEEEMTTSARCTNGNGNSQEDKGPAGPSDICQDEMRRAAAEEEKGVWNNQRPLPQQEELEEDAEKKETKGFALAAVPPPPLGDDKVTFNSSVMFVRQPDNNRVASLPDVVHDSSAEVDAASPRTRFRVQLDTPLISSPPPLSPKRSPTVKPVVLPPKSPPPVWLGSTSDSSVVIECGQESSWITQRPQHPPVTQHPFTQRAHMRYTKCQQQKNHDVSITTCKDSGVTLTQESLEDSFEKILRTADHSLHQAESILSSLRKSEAAKAASVVPKSASPSLPTKITQPPPLPPPRAHLDQHSSDSDSLGSDIETNIRRLERTQAKINAALEAFRHVKYRKDDDTPVGSQSLCRPLVVSPEEQARALQLSRTAPAKLQERVFPAGSNATSSEAPPKLNCLKPAKKTRLFRRHSFNLEQSSDSLTTASSTPQDSSSLWYDGDVESDYPKVNSNTMKAVNKPPSDNDNGSWSDSEGGFMHPPIKSRLRGLLGSFGRGKKRLPRRKPHHQQQYHTPLEATVSAPVEAMVQITPVSANNNETSVSDYARRIELLANGLSSGAAMEVRPASPASSSGYYTPPSTGGGEASAIVDNTNNNNKTSTQKSESNESSLGSSQRNSVSSGSEDQSDSEEPQSAPSSSSTSAQHDHQQRNLTKAYYIARELMTSEKVFVEVLKLVNVEFREFVQKARRDSKSGLLPDTDFSRLFNNLPELQTLNEDLLQDFEERISNWTKLSKIADVIVKKGPFLKLYTTYIREFSAVNYHFDECCQRYPKFSKLVRDFEKRDSCRNLKLKHFMLKPVQRLPQYKLLLEDYLRHLAHDSVDFDDTTNALRIVTEAAEHANNTIRQGDKFRKMLKLQSRLGDYFELIRPGRDLIKEGELQKISRKGVGPRYFILLSDCLLYTTYSGSWSGTDTTSLRVSYQIPLATLQVRLPPKVAGDGDSATEFHLTSPVRSFSVRASNVRDRNHWLDSLNTAIEEYASRKATFVNVNDVAMAAAINTTSQDCKTKDCKVGSSAPIWVPDRRVTMCQKCAVEFTVLVRRHHCRACGQVICSSCSANKAPLRYLEFESARVCDSCYDALDKELGNVEGLKGRFKKRDYIKPGRYVPQRLKVSANGEGAQMSGYLRKRQKSSKWKRMWFVLKDRVLYAYKAPEDSVATDTFPILGFVLDTLSDKNFELYEGESGGLVFQLAHPGSEMLIFCADNDNVCEKWVAALSEAVKLDTTV